MERSYDGFHVRITKVIGAYDSIWVIVDRMTKLAHLLLVKTPDPVRKLAKLYQKEIVWLHSVPVLIMSNRDARFTSMF